MYFTKFTWAKAMPTKEAVNVVLTLKEVSTCSLLISILLLCCFFSFSCTMMTHYHPSALTFQLFYIMGLPSVMTTDQGREFCNHPLQSHCLLSLYSNHTVSSASIPIILSPQPLFQSCCLLSLYSNHTVSSASTQLWKTVTCLLRNVRSNG